MVRVPLTDAERRRGQRLGELLRKARAQRSMAEVATAAGVSAETLRKIETGRIASPALFTVAALADVLDLSLDVVVSATAQEAAPDVAELPAGAAVPASGIGPTSGIRSVPPVHDAHSPHSVPSS